MNRRSFLAKIAALPIAAKLGLALTSKLEAAGMVDLTKSMPIKVGVDWGHGIPRGIVYLVNNDNGLFQEISRPTYSELKARWLATSREENEP